jgi:hypothetical protein
VGRSEELVELVVREPSVEEEGCEFPMARQRAGSLPGGHTRKYRPRTFSQVRFGWVPCVDLSVKDALIKIIISCGIIEKHLLYRGDKHKPV